MTGVGPIPGIKFFESLLFHTGAMDYEAAAQSSMVVRNIKVGRDAGVGQRWYLNDDPVATTFYSALSITFPLGERFFIESVRPYRGEASATLKREITDFIRQEALHTREHAAFNAHVSELGYTIEAATARTALEIGRFDDRSPMRRLGLTIALEHLTALLAHELLASPHHLAGAPDSVQRLWRWHALEEIEHKAVAFDTFLHVTRGWSPLRRWLFRAFALLEATWLFAKVLRLNMADLFAQDGLAAAKMSRLTLGYLFGSHGIVRAMRPGWTHWFRPGFHPWQHDDRALIAPVAAEFVLSGVAS